MPTYTPHNLKRDPKGRAKQPLRSSERAWVDRAYPSEGKRTHTYLEFVRYYRWYCNRSPLLGRVLGSTWNNGTQQMEPRYYTALQRPVA